MGARVSSLSDQDINELELISQFTPNQIKRLYKRFKQLDRDNSGTLNFDKLLMIPELAMNPFSQKIIAFLMKNQPELDFKNFIKNLSVFSRNATKEDKLELAFKIYQNSEKHLQKPLEFNDLLKRRDGDFITKQDLISSLKLMFGNNLADEQISLFAENILKEFDLDGDNQLSLKEFQLAFRNSDIYSKMTIEF